MNAVQRLLTQTATSISASGELTGLDGIRAAVCSLTPKDVGLRPEQVPGDGANCGYIRIVESQLCTVCIFVLRKGAKLPLHSHPGMTGLLKVLYGQLDLSSYVVPTADKSLARGQRITATFDTKSRMRADDEPSLLMPSAVNVHEICAAENSAFLDILTPPYNPAAGRACAYFRDVSGEELIAGSKRLLEVIPEPDDFWTQPMVYEGLPRQGS